MSDFFRVEHSLVTAQSILEQVVNEYVRATSVNQIWSDSFEDTAYRSHLVRILELLCCMLGGKETLRDLKLRQRTPQKWIKFFLYGQSTSVESWKAHNIFLKSRVLEQVDEKARPQLRSLQRNHPIERNQRIWADILDITVSGDFGELDPSNTADILSDSWWESDPACAMDKVTSMKRNLCIGHTEFSMVGIVVSCFWKANLIRLNAEPTCEGTRSTRFNGLGEVTCSCV